MNDYQQGDALRAIEAEEQASKRFVTHDKVQELTAENARLRAEHKRICDRLRVAVDKHKIGSVGDNLEEIVCEALNAAISCSESYERRACNLAHERERLRAALEWQPIATAPLDGTPVEVWVDVAAVEVIHLAWYRGVQEWEAEGKHCGDWSNLEEWEGWWSYTTGSLAQEKLEGVFRPTRWRPYCHASSTQAETGTAHPVASTPTT